MFDAINEVRHATYGNSLSYFSPRPAPYFKNVLKIFEEKTYNLKKNFKVTIPNQWHCTKEYVNEYIEIAITLSMNQK